MGTNYVPSNDAEFGRFFSNLNRYVDEKCGGNVPVWTFIPAEARNNLNDLYAAWDEAFEAVKVPHTPVQTEAKNDAKTAAVAAIRPSESPLRLTFPLLGESFYVQSFAIAVRESGRYRSS
jgi:hypothetical protein